MEQLNGLDAFFTHGESDRTPLHIGALLVYAPPQRKHPDFRYREVLQQLRSILPSSPIFRRKLLRVPAGLDHPYWIEDRDFRLENHLHRCRLRPQSNYDDLQALIAKLHARPMDFQRPLWEAHIIEGLGPLAEYPANSFGLYLKVHHAAMDGVSGADILAAMHGLEPGTRLKEIPEDHWQGEAPPSTSTLLWNAAGNGWRRPLRLAQKGRSLLPGLRQHRSTDGDPSHRPRVTWQRSPFGQSVCGSRQLQSLHFDFATLRQIRRLLPGTTLNHVILSVVGGAMRRYLIALNALSAHPLNSLVPVNLRKTDSKNGGNMIGMMVASLRTDIEDPLQRLQAVRDGAGAARRFSEDIGRSSFTDLVQELPSATERLAFKAIAGLTRLPGGLPMPVATVVSNIPGPPVDLYLNHAKLVDLQGIGMLTDGCGLFHVAMSYKDKLHLSVLSSPRTLSRPELYRRCLQDAYDELAMATRREELVRQA